MDLFKKIVYFILSIQEKILTGRLNKTLGIKNAAKRKKYYANGCLLSLNSLADDEKKQMETELELILKNADYSTDELLKYIENQGTKVYRLDNTKFLHSLGENEGFIYPQKGAIALCISLFTEKKPSLKTPEVFIISKGEINKYYLIYHIYNWYTFKHNVTGIGADELNMLNKYLYNASDEEIKKLQLEDIYKLKDAIKQDKSAIEFVFKLCQKYEASKSALEKLKNNGTNI